MRRLLTFILSFFVHCAKWNFILHGDGLYSDLGLSEGAEFGPLSHLSVKLFLVARLLVKCQNQVLEVLELLVFLFLEPGVEHDTESSFDLEYRVKDSFLSMPSSFAFKHESHQCVSVFDLHVFFPLIEQP